MLGDPAALDRLERRVDIDVRADVAHALRGRRRGPPRRLRQERADAAREGLRDRRLRYHVEKQTRRSTPAIDLDGVVPNSSRRSRTPSRRCGACCADFDLPMLREPGTYVVELRRQRHQQPRRRPQRPPARASSVTTAAGQAFRVYDEAGVHLKDASIWFGGREYAADAERRDPRAVLDRPGPAERRAAPRQPLDARDVHHAGRVVPSRRAVHATANRSSPASRPGS